VAAISRIIYRIVVGAAIVVAVSYHCFIRSYGLNCQWSVLLDVIAGSLIQQSIKSKEKKAQKIFIIYKDPQQAPCLRLP
jgi:hypothetical protein